MNIEDLNKIKNEYRGLSIIREENLKLQERQKELELLPSVKEYLNILKILNNYSKYSFHGVEKLTDEELLARAISSVHIKGVDNIFVYYKTKDQNGNCVDYNSDIAYVSTYMLLEKFIIEEIDVKEREEFEKTNTVIFPPKDKNAIDFLEELKQEYFTVAVNEGIDSAKKYALERSKENKNN